MGLRLFARRARRPFAPPAPRFFRPRLEGFEDRVVPASPVADAAHVAQATAAGNLIDITNINLTNFQIVNNVLHATGTVTGTLAGLPFTTQITDFALQLVPDNPGTTAVECSVLNLELAPIHLALLGLHVDTSAICLDITATQGGGLLGDLLCGLAGGGVGGLGVPLIPTANQLTDLVNGLINILEGALNTQPGAAGNGSVCTGRCEILDLTLGPVDLSLLGLNVSLDNCANGPVEVCISANRGEGLLGNLLCGLAGRNRLGNLSLADITQLARAAANALADGVVSPLEAAALRVLFNRLTRV